MQVAQTTEESSVLDKAWDVWLQAFIIAGCLDAVSLWLLIVKSSLL